ncbi:Flp pilus assembly protein CpaB [Actinomadura scrupuli]|uniref:Flp pilus assembly protein CpaB n=1 Tax=Actinomadura scrupuli TaxID=559629 RepID=UPI003D9730B8
MNPRQRRGLLLMIVAGIGAVAVFIAVIGYVGNVRSQAAADVGEMTTALRAKANIPGYQPITAAELEQVQIPRRWVTTAFVRDPASLQGKVAAAPIPTGAYLQQGMLIDAPSLKPDQREIAIMIDAETGVAGKVQPGSIVDVYSTFDAAATGGNRAANGACALRILNRVTVINVGTLTSRPDGKQQGVTNSVIPVTFALDPTETLRLTYAESFAHKVRLALVGGLRDSQPPVNKLCKTPVVGP